MSKWSKFVNRNKNTFKTVATVFPPAALAVPTKPTLQGGVKGLAIGAAGATAVSGAGALTAGSGGGFFSGFTDKISSFFSGGSNSASNLLGGLSPRGDILPTPQGSSSITDKLLSGVVSYFRTTPTGKKVEAEATTQAVNDKILTIVKTPWVWIAGSGVIIILFILFRKR